MEQSMVRGQLPPHDFQHRGEKRFNFERVDFDIVLPFETPGITNLSIREIHGKYSEDRKALLPYAYFIIQGAADGHFVRPICGLKELEKIVDAEELLEWKDEIAPFIVDKLMRTARSRFERLLIMEGEVDNSGKKEVLCGGEVSFAQFGNTNSWAVKAAVNPELKNRRLGLAFQRARMAVAFDVFKCYKLTFAVILEPYTYYFLYDMKDVVDQSCALNDFHASEHYNTNIIFTEEELKQRVKSIQNTLQQHGFPLLLPNARILAGSGACFIYSLHNQVDIYFRKDHPIPPNYHPPTQTWEIFAETYFNNFPPVLRRKT